MAHTLALYRSNRYRGRGGVTVPPEAHWQKPEPGNPWKTTTPFQPQEIAQMVSNGVAKTRLVEFEPKSFSTDLVPATKLNLPPVAPGSFGTTRGTVNLLTWADKPNTEFSLDTKTGIIFQDRGAAQIKLYAGAGALTAPAAEDGDEEEAEEEAPVIPAEQVDSVTITPAQGDQKIVLKAKTAGLHHIQVSRGAGTKVVWPAGTKTVMQASQTSTPTIVGRWNMYFYVPKGTKVVGGYATGPGRVRDGSGKQVYEFDKATGDLYFSIPVTEGQDGKLWKFEFSAGKRVLLTVPPFLARSAEELLLPREVVEADAR